MNLSRIFFSLCLLICLLGSGQLLAQKNVFSLQLHNLVGGHIAPSYERALGERASLRLAVGITPTRQIPGSNILRSLLIQNPDDSNFGMNGTYVRVSVTPELRGYLGKKGAPNGFYGSLFGRYGYHNIVAPYSIPLRQSTIDTEASLRIQVFGMGLGIGYQWLINQVISLDFYAGGGLSYTGFRLQVFDENLTQEGYEALFEALAEELKVNLDPEDLPRFITNRGLTIRAPLVLPILRVGLGIGFAI